MGTMFNYFNTGYNTTVLSRPSQMVGRAYKGLGANAGVLFGPSGMISAGNGEAKVVSPASGMIGNGSYISGGPRVHGRASNR